MKKFLIYYILTKKRALLTITKGFAMRFFNKKTEI